MKQQNEIEAAIQTTEDLEKVGEEAKLSLPARTRRWSGFFWKEVTKTETSLSLDF